MGHGTYLNLKIHGDYVILNGSAYPTYIYLLHNYSIDKIYMEDITPSYDEIDPEDFGYLFFYDDSVMQGELLVKTFINIFNYSKSQRPEECVNLYNTWEDVYNKLHSVYLKLVQWLDEGLITHDYYIEFEVY